MGPHERWIFGYCEPFLRWLLPTLFVVFSVVGVVTLVSSFVSGDPPALFEAVCLAAGVWSAYRLLWRCGYQMEVDGTRVIWKAVLRTREVDLLDITGNRGLFGFGDSFQVRDAPGLVLLHRAGGWHEFLNALDGRHPSHPFTESWNHSLIAVVPVADRLYGYYERWE